MCLEELWRMKKLEARLMLSPWTMKPLEEMHSQTNWPSKILRQRALVSFIYISTKNSSKSILFLIAMFLFGNIVDWWRSYGGRAIEIQRFARRIVSLCVASSGCERNWSTFEFVSIVIFILYS